MAKGSEPSFQMTSMSQERVPILPNTVDNTSKGRFPATDRRTRTKARKTKFGIAGFLADVFCLLASLGFLVLGVFMVTLQGSEQSKFGDTIVEASQAAPTIWPILFAAALGSMAKSLARRLIERGGKLLYIEHLMSSQTLAGVVSSPFQLRFFGIWPLVLVLLWLFSPVGSQASLRALQLRDEYSEQSIADISYMSPSMFADMEIGLKMESGPNEESIDPLLLTALYARESGFQYMQDVLPDYAETVKRLGPELFRFGADAMGNPRVPKLESLPGYDANEPHKWIEVPRGDGIVNYASLIGVRVENVPFDLSGNASWIMGANYLLFSCHPWHVVDRIDAILERRQLDRDDSFLRENFHHMFSTYNSSLSNMTSRALYGNLFKGQAVIIDTEAMDWPLEDIHFVDSEWPWRNKTYEFPERDIFFGMKGYSSEAAFTKCSVSLSYVDVNVTFQASRQGATPFVVGQMRRSPEPPTSLRLHPFQNPTIARKISDYFPRMLDYFRENFQGRRPPLAIQYIWDPAHFRNALFLYDTSLGEFLAGNLTIPQFEDRFGLVFNTFWRAFAHESGNLGLEYYLDRPDVSPDFQISTTSGQILFPPQPRYVVITHWIILYFIGSVLMTGAVVISLALRFTFRGPDILGYVSSIARYSGVLGTRVNSAMDATDVTKYHGDQLLALVEKEQGREYIIVPGSTEGRPVSKAARHQTYM